jgi:hypothetical protein
MLANPKKIVNIKEYAKIDKNSKVEKVDFIFQ